VTMIASLLERALARHPAGHEAGELAQVTVAVLNNGGLGYAMAFGMVLVMGTAILLYVVLQRRAERWRRA